MADMTKMTDSCRTGFDHEEGYFDNRKDANLTQGWLTDAFFFRTKLEWNSINNVKRWWLVAVWDGFKFSSECYRGCWLHSIF